MNTISLQKCIFFKFSNTRYEVNVSRYYKRWFMATKFISFANNQRFLRVTNSRTNTITYVSKLNLVIEKDNHESFYLKNDDFIKYYKYKDVLYPSSRDMANLVTKLVDICQGDAATENMLLDEIKRSPVVTELKVFDKDPYERTFCTKTEALVGDTSSLFANELMHMDIDGTTGPLADADIRQDIYGRTRDYGSGAVPDYTLGSLVGYNMGHDSEREQIYELKLCAADGIRFATATHPILKRSIIQQSKEYVDIPMGKTRIALMSAAMIRGPSDQVSAMNMYDYTSNKTVTFISRVGMFNDETDITIGGSQPSYRYSNGIYFEYKRVFKEDDGDWSVDDTAYDADNLSPDIINELNLVLMINGGIVKKIPQSNFNIDRVNGNGPSGVVFDPSRITTFMFKFGTMNDTVITAGIFNEGNMILVHTFVHEDLKDFNYSAKLPMRWDFQVESTIQQVAGSSTNTSLIVDNMVMLRGSGAVYSNETLDVFNENKTFLLPVKKNFIDNTSGVVLSSNPTPTPNVMVYHSMNPAVRVFKTFTPLFNKDIMFGIRLGGDYRRNKVQLNSIMFQSDDATNKTVLWKIIRNGKYRRLMWRLNIPELRQNRSLKILYTNSVGDSHYYTPNDITLHRAQTLPVLMYDQEYADDITGKEATDPSFEGTRNMQPCAFDGSYIKQPSGEKKYVDINDVEDPANGSFSYQYFEGNDKDSAFGHIKYSMCELWSMESQMTNLDSTSLTSSFTMIPQEGKYFVDDPDNPGTSLVRYAGSGAGVVRDYESAFINGYTANDIFDVEETYTSKPNIQASGIAQFTNYTTIDISNMTPLFSDIEGKSDEYVLQVEFGPNSVSDVNLQTAVNWVEYQ